MLPTVETLTDSEVPRFLSFFDRPTLTVSKANQLCRDRLICLLMLDAGLRVGEVVALFVADLFFSGMPVSSIVLDSGRAEKGCERSVPVTTRLRDAISLMNLNVWQPLGLVPESLAFAKDRSSNTITVRQIERMVSRVGIASIARDVHPHMLRHTFATRLMRKTNERVVQQLLGHKSILSTQVYTHPSANDLQTAIAAIE